MRMHILISIICLHVISGTVCANSSGLRQLVPARCESNIRHTEAVASVPEAGRPLYAYIMQHQPSWYTFLLHPSAAPEFVTLSKEVIRLLKAVESIIESNAGGDTGLCEQVRSICQCDEEFLKKPAQVLTRLQDDAERIEGAQSVLSLFVRTTRNWFECYEQLCMSSSMLGQLMRSRVGIPLMLAVGGVAWYTAHKSKQYAQHKQAGIEAYWRWLRGLVKGHNKDLESEEHGMDECPPYFILTNELTDMIMCAKPDRSMIDTDGSYARRVREYLQAWRGTLFTADEVEQGYAIHDERSASLLVYPQFFSQLPALHNPDHEETAREEYLAIMGEILTQAGRVCNPLRDGSDRIAYCKTILEKSEACQKVFNEKNMLGHITVFLGRDDSGEGECNEVRRIWQARRWGACLRAIDEWLEVYEQALTSKVSEWAAGVPERLKDLAKERSTQICDAFGALKDREDKEHCAAARVIIAQRCAYWKERNRREREHWRMMSSQEHVEAMRERKALIRRILDSRDQQHIAWVQERAEEALKQRAAAQEDAAS